METVKRTVVARGSGVVGDEEVECRGFGGRETILYDTIMVNP